MAVVRLVAGKSAHHSLSHLSRSFRLSPFRSSHTRLVSERVVDLTAIDVDGTRHPVRGLTQHTLLRALKNHRLIDPECHRLEDIYACSGECRVVVSPEWLPKLPPRSDEEYDILVKASGKGKVEEQDRLGCQILLERDLRGMVVVVPELKPWDTP